MKGASMPKPLTTPDKTVTLTKRNGFGGTYFWEFECHDGAWYANSIVRYGYPQETVRTPYPTGLANMPIRAIHSHSPFDSWKHLASHMLFEYLMNPEVDHA